MSFSPPCDVADAAGLIFAGDADALRLNDASQRRPRCARPLNGGGDASQRKPISKVSLGVAFAGGDASQRALPESTTDAVYASLASGLVLPPLAASGTVESSIPIKNASDPISICGSPQGITGTRPVKMADASQRSPAASMPANSATSVNPAVSMPASSVSVVYDVALRSWLSGNSGISSGETDVDLAGRLRAAAPEVYED